MPDGGAERLLRILANRGDAPSVAVVSGDGSEEFLYRLAALGAKEFFAKPVRHRELIDWMRNTLAAHRGVSYAA
jgi:DNA-binding response OmpR family regulator